MTKDKDLYNCGNSEGDEVVFRNVNGNPHTPISVKTGDVLLGDNKYKRDKEQLAEYVDDFRKGKTVPKIINVTEVTARERTEIEKLTKTKLNATKHTLALSEMQHTEKRHGMKGNANHSMSELEDYKNIIDTLHNFDKVDFCRRKDGKIDYSAYVDKNGNHAPKIKYTKNIESSVQSVIEAITDIEKSSDIKIISAYKEKIKE